MKNKIKKILESLCIECGGYIRENDVDYALEKILSLIKKKMT